MFIAVLYTVAKIWMQPMCPVSFDRSVDKDMECVCAYIYIKADKTGVWN